MHIIFIQVTGIILLYTMSGYRKIILFLASSHFMIHVYTQVIPALLPTLKNELGISLVQSSYLLSLPLLVNVVAFVPAGVISDRYGPRVICACFLLTGLGAVSVALSNNIYVLAVGAALLGLGSTLYHPPGLKAASLVDPEHMNLVMSIYLAGGTTGIALGPISLGVLMPIIGWRRAMLLWVPCQVALSYLSLVFARYDHVEEVVIPEPFISGFRSIMAPVYLLVIAAGGFLELTVVNLSGFMTTYFNTSLGLSESLSSIIFGLGPLAGIVGAFTGGRLGDKYGNTRALLGIIIVIIVLLAVMPVAGAVFLAASIYIVYRSLVSACMPLFNKLVALNSDSQHRSLAFGFYFMVSNIGASIMPLVTSVLAERRGISVLFPLSVVLLLPSVVLVYIIGKKQV